MRGLIKKFGRNQRGNVAMVFGLAVVPIVGIAGLAIDHGRASHFNTILQNAVDASALAGAIQIKPKAIRETADAYMKAGLPGGLSVNNVVYSVDIQSGEVTVSATAEVPTTLGSLFRPEMPVSAKATASRGEPVRIVDLAVTNFNADAWDANSIYWYIVPKGGGLPADEDLHLLLSNDPANPAPPVPDSIQIGVDEEIGFALFNVTGGVRGYGKNSYGQPQGSLHKFYSQQEPENLKTAGQPNCKAGTVQNAWDDNGGGSDDNDYNDAVYDFSCKTVQTDPKTVRLIR